MEINTKDLRRVHAFVVEEKDAVDLDAHRINFIVSTDVVDRDNEQVLPEAIAEAIGRKEFVRNPVCLACHKHRLDNGEPPGIGSWDTETRKLKKHHVEMILQFDVEYELGNKYWIVYKNKTMRAVSIGFRILDGHEETKDGKRIYIITKIELYEISCVAVGVNPDAVSKIKALYGDTAGNGDVAEQLKASQAEPADQVKQHLDNFAIRIEDSLDEIKLILAAVPDGFARDLLGNPDDSSDPAGDQDKAEQILSTLNEIKT